MAMRPLDDGLEPVSEINVTPFIDVVLVLLIVFMVAAPLATVNIPVNLPAAASTADKPKEKPVYLTIKADKSLLIGERVVAPSQLVEALNAATGGNHERRIFLRADEKLPYGALMSIFSKLRKADYYQVALVGKDAG